MAATPYNTENIIVSTQIMNTAKYATGTYKKGQILGRITASGLFTAYNPSASNGAEIVVAVCPVDITLTATIPTAPVVRGEFSRAGVAAVMDSLSIPLTDKLIGQCWDAGIILN